MLFRSLDCEPLYSSLDRDTLWDRPPLKRVSKISSRAGADSPTEILAGKILREAIRLRVNVGKDPDGLAAAALDLAARIRGSMVMQRDLAKAAGVSEVTIRSRMRDLKAAAKSLGLPDVA